MQGLDVGDLNRQVIANCSFEHEEGRLSGVALCKNLCESFPEAILDEHAQSFALALSLRLVNDSSARCRQAISEVCVKMSYDVFLASC